VRVGYGRTLSYRQLAAEAGSPRAARAAGSAMASNPLPFLIPCHRVIRSDGSPGQYGGSPALKVRLLEMEKSFFALHETS